MINTYKDINLAKLKILEMITEWERWGYEYYIDIENKNGFYYSIKVREVSEWNDYSEEENKTKNNSNIIFFNNLKKNIEN